MRFKFSLNTLLLTVAILAVLSTYVGECYRRHEASVAAASRITRVGGRVSWTRPAWSPFREIRSVVWLGDGAVAEGALSECEILWTSLGSVERVSIWNTAVAGDDLLSLGQLPNITSILLVNTPVDNLEWLRSCDAVEYVYLRDVPVTDADLAALSAMENLRHLDLINTEISGSGLAYLSCDDSLERLWLCGSAGSDAACEHLPRFINLTDLSLESSGVTDEGMSHIRSLPALTSLSLRKTRITGETLGIVSELPHLAQLRCSDTSVDDAAIAQLASMRSLRRVWLQKTRVTDQGVGRLKRTLPNLEVQTDEPITE